MKVRYSKNLNYLLIVQNVLKNTGDLAEQLSNNITQTAEKKSIFGVWLGCKLRPAKAFSIQGTPVLL